MAEMIPCTVDMTIAEITRQFPVTVSDSGQNVTATLATEIQAVLAEPYPGPYSVQPGSESVVLPTAGMQMLNDITIGPVPSNYGLITWNGSTLTVS